MAGARRMESARLDDADIGEALAENSAAFEFFQAVRLLERLHPESSRLGDYGDPADEAVHFSAHPSIAFPAGEIHEIEFRPAGPPRMSVNVMGLIGPLGVLPHQYTLMVAERNRSRDRAMQAFLDLFHHRILSLFYRAWEKHRFAAGFERAGTDRLTEHLFDLMGLGVAGLRDRVGISADSLLFYAGLLTSQQRSAVALEQLLADHFSVPVEVEQFVGGWYPLERSTQCSIGEEDTVTAQLGVGAVVGDEIWDPQTRVRIRIGPLSRDEYDRFLPTGSAFRVLQRLTRFFGHDQFDVEVQLVLARDEVAGCVLGADDEQSHPLGWGTWIKTAPMTRDRDETILAI
jgi:type VI secretion system protein ImpH